MKKSFLLIALLVTTISAQVTGLSGWDIFLDPGHSQTQNDGIFGLAEPELTLQTALHLRQLLLTKTDIDTVWSSRYDDFVNVSLSERTNDANARGASWYHSIHSNAGGESANNVLLLWGEWLDGTPDPPVGGEAMSDIMVNHLSAAMRIPKSSWGSTGDCSFYKGWTTYCQNNPTTPYLWVNKATSMPSELSEQGFHTNAMQNQRNMNAEFTRLVAYSKFWTILDFHSIERPYPGILTGIIRNIESKQPINGATIKVDGKTYTTDTFESLFYKYTTNPDLLKNGFYFFEDLPDQAHEVIVSAEGYYSDTLQIGGLIDNFATFLDINLTANTPPYVTMSTPAQDQSLFPSWKSLTIRFNRPMNEASVEAAFSMTPAHTGTFAWSADQKIMTFAPDDSLNFETAYVVEIAGSAVDVFNHALDGDLDGVGGDTWTLQFTSGKEDMEPPVIIQSYPVNNEKLLPLKPVLTVVYNEHLAPASFNEGMINVVEYSSGKILNTSADLQYVGEQSVITIYLREWLEGDNFYMIRVMPGLEDGSANQIKSAKYLYFRTRDYFHETWSIDDFDGEFQSYWWKPSGSGSTTGLALEGNLLSGDSTQLIQYSGSTQSMQLDYAWDSSASDWLIRLHLSGGPAQQVRFNNSYKMEAFVFGDGKGNKMRYAVREANNSIEVSPWYTVDWYGWRLVSWDMSNDGTGTWIGDGSFNNPLYLESLQFTHEPAAALSGTYYVDDLRIAKVSTVSADPARDVVPVKYSLLDNYPNPFNPWTNIPFTLPQNADIRISIYNLRGEEVDQVLSGSFEAGRHLTRWDASNVSSGIYLVKMDANGLSTTRKITVLK